MKRNLALATVAAAMMICSSASAAFVITDGSFGTGVAVHSNGTQTGDGEVFGNVDGALVTFTSTNILSVNGNGEATIDANDLSNLQVVFAATNTYSDITFAIKPINNGTFSLNINGGAIEFLTNTLTGGGENKFIVSATGGDFINTLNFTFTPAVDDAKQFRLAIGGQIPEPATWAMMVIGFGGLGAVLRSKRRRQRLAIT